MKRAQIGIIDLIIAVAIVLVLSTMIAISWNSYITKQNQQISFNDLQIKAFQITDTLVNNVGSPSAWETVDNVNKVNVTGLVENKTKVLSKEKLKAFVDSTNPPNLNYNRIKELFNIEMYEFYFKVTDFNGALVTIDTTNIETGDNPTTYAPNCNQNSVSLKRRALLDNQKILVNFILWVKRC